MNLWVRSRSDIQLAGQSGGQATGVCDPFEYLKQNKTLPIEEATCRPFLMEAIASLPRLTTFIALGKVAHDSLCRSLGVPLAKAKFAHGAVHELKPGLRLIDSYHCSRYNQNTKRLNATMFEAVFEQATSFTRPA